MYFKKNQYSLNRLSGMIWRSFPWHPQSKNNSNASSNLVKVIVIAIAIAIESSGSRTADKTASKGQQVVQLV